MSLLAKTLERTLTWPSNPDVLKRISRGLSRLVVAVDSRTREMEARSAILPTITSTAGETLSCHIRAKDTPWSGEELGECSIPGMITPEECQYYLYISRFYSGVGELVELGPWLGRSTYYICRGLASNPNFSGRRLFVYDDFVWRTNWMDDYVDPSKRLPQHADFMQMFEECTAEFSTSLHVEKRKITDYDGNEALEQLTWDRGPIEILFVDCGRTFVANESWWNIFSPHFIPNRTLLILEDWNTHRVIPVQWFNQLKQWVDSKGPELQVIDEISRGGIGTFLYRGG